MLERETLLKRHNAVQELDLLGRKGDIERLDVGEQVLDLPAADDRADVWELLHTPCDCH